jgi:hypothetical protein
MYNNCTEQPCSVTELKRGLPTRGNAAGLAKGYSSTPPLGVAACPPGGCPPNWLSSDDRLLGGFDRDFVELVFQKMLRLPVTFRSFGTFAEMVRVRSPASTQQRCVRGPVLC